MKGVVAGTLVLACVTVAATDGNAMPIQPLESGAAATSNLEHVWWRGGYGYGWRGGLGWRRPWGYGFGWRRPIYGYGFGWRRRFYGYGWRRPIYGYGWRRW